MVEAPEAAEESSEEEAGVGDVVEARLPADALLPALLLLLLLCDVEVKRDAASTDKDPEVLSANGAFWAMGRTSRGLEDCGISTEVAAQEVADGRVIGMEELKERFALKEVIVESDGMFVVAADDAFVVVSDDALVVAADDAFVVDVEDAFANETFDPDVALLVDDTFGVVDIVAATVAELLCPR